jgi:hypothetical protein
MWPVTLMISAIVASPSGEPDAVRVQRAIL